MEVDEVVWQAPDDAREDKSGPLPGLSAFFAWATSCQGTGRRKSGFEQSFPEPWGWSLRLSGTAADSPTIFAHEFHLAGQLPGSRRLIRPAGTVDAARESINVNSGLQQNWSIESGFSGGLSEASQGKK